MCSRRSGERAELVMILIELSSLFLFSRSQGIPRPRRSGEDPGIVGDGPFFHLCMQKRQAGPDRGPQKAETGIFCIEAYNPCLKSKKRK